MSEQDQPSPRPLRIDPDELGQSYPLETMTRGGQRRRAQVFNIQEKSGRLPPQATDVEQSVLGAMLIEREAIPRAVEILPPDAFYTSKHQKIYQAIISLFERGNPVDLITLTDELKRRGELDDVGGAYYLTELTTRVASAANVDYHARIIAEKSLLRKMIETMTVLVGKAYDPSSDAFELLDHAEKEIFQISDTQLRKAASSMNEVVKETLEKLEKIHGQTGGITGVPSGFHRLDEMTGGWQPSDLVIVAARPSMGKCLGKGTPVLMYDGTVKPVEEIRVGDLLMGDDSTPRRVLSLARGRERMYWIRQKRGMDYRVNESHILSLKKSRSGDRVPRGTVVNLSVKAYLEQAPKWQNDHKGYKVAVDFPEQPVPLDPYLLGLWLGDGKRDSARIYTTDEEVVDYLYALADTRGEQVTVHDADRACPAYLVTGGKQGAFRTDSIQAQLRVLGVLDNKHIPHVYLANSREQRLRLLAGLIDSDGHRNAGYGGTYEITQTDRRLAEQIKFLCDTLGYRTSLKTKTARIAKTGYEGTVHRVRFNGDIDAIPVRIARKKAEPWRDFRDWTVTGITVEPDGVDDYYGFELDGNRLFVLGDGTVTHNTALSLAVARNAALHPERTTGVAYFSLEMSAQQLAQRLLTSEARVDAQAARTGRLNEEDWPRLARAAGRLSAAPIFIDDTPGLSILELRAKCRRLKAEHDIGLVVVDYLQLMHGTTTNRNANREQEIAQISRSLKSLAKELNVPVVALSQLSRAVETRGGDKRPQLSDLRESGCLTGDSLVTLADTGAQVPIRDLVGRSGFAVWALNERTQRLERATVSRAFSTGVKPVYRLTTRLGREIRATGNHKFLTIHGWKRLDELTTGDHLALPRQVTQPDASPEPMTMDELALLGHLIGDGCTLPRHVIQYTTRELDEEVQAYVADLQGNTNRDIIPKAAWRTYAVPAMERAGLTSRTMQAELGMSYCGTSLYKTNLSRTRARRVADVVASPSLRRLAMSDIYWDEFVGIEPDGVEEVFDLTVPGPHNFVANDIIVHNSIEQDADVVMFIYRAERYGITVDEHGNSTEGLAEIIIGKQRNGPIGNVNLAFVHQFARFENLTTYYNPPGGGGGFGGGIASGSFGGDDYGDDAPDSAPF